MFGKIFRRLFILLLIIGIGIAALGYWQYRQVMDAHLAPSVHGGTIIHVANGSNLKQIANELESRGVIQQAWPLRIYGRLRGDAPGVQCSVARSHPRCGGVFCGLHYHLQSVP